MHSHHQYHPVPSASPGDRSPVTWKVIWLDGWMDGWMDEPHSVLTYWFEYPSKLKRALFLLGGVEIVILCDSSSITWQPKVSQSQRNMAVSRRTCCPWVLGLGLVSDLESFMSRKATGFSPNYTSVKTQNTTEMCTRWPMTSNQYHDYD